MAGRPSRDASSPGSHRRRLRRFGLTVGCAGLVLGTLLLWRGRPAWPFFGAAGFLLALVGLSGQAPAAGDLPLDLAYVTPLILVSLFLQHPQYSC